MSERVLVVIPAFNEAATLGVVMQDLRSAAPDFDRLVVNDGSTDMTDEVMAQLEEHQLRLPSNLGYGRALQTGLIWGLKHGYDVIVSFDADGQHGAADAVRVVDRLRVGDADVVIGARFGPDRPYVGPLDRRLGQMLFSRLTRYLLGHRFYDTTSGLKALKPAACRSFVDANFVDFHTEVLVRLQLLGFKVVEHPIEARDREAGTSMHSLISIVKYPLKTLLMTAIAAVDAWIERKRQDDTAGDDYP